MRRRAPGWSIVLVAGLGVVVWGLRERSRGHAPTEVGDPRPPVVARAEEPDAAAEYAALKRRSVDGRDPVEARLAAAAALARLPRHSARLGRPPVSAAPPSPSEAPAVPRG
mgnify:CR=1 FL=1